MGQQLVGVYPTIPQAIEALHELKDEGYERHQVTVLAKKDVTERLPWNVEGDVESAEVDHEEKKSIWDSVKGLFVTTKDEYEAHHSDELLDIRQKYLSELEEGQLVVLLDKDAHKAHENVNELDDQRSPLSTAEAQDYERDGYKHTDQ